MRKVLEYTNVTYYYDSREERDEHVKLMEAEGWECSGQIKESLSIHSNESVWCGKFTKYKFIQNGKTDLYSKKNL